MYINEDLQQPLETDPTFRRWRTKNAIAKGWLINSMELRLIGNYICFPTAKAVWNAKIYFDRGDTSHVYDLIRKVMKLKQREAPLKHIPTAFKDYGGRLIFKDPIL